MKNEYETERICFTSSKYARNLIRNGFKVVDIAPNTKIKMASIFIFELTDDLKHFMKQNPNR